MSSAVLTIIGVSIIAISVPPFIFGATGTINMSEESWKKWRTAMIAGWGISVVGGLGIGVAKVLEN